MVVGAEIQARADAEAAIELAKAARGAALVDALRSWRVRERIGGGVRSGGGRGGARPGRGGIRARGRGHAAIDALATAGLIEAALLQAATAEAAEMLDERSDEPPDTDPGGAPRG